MSDVSDITNDTISCEIGYMDPEDLLARLVAFSGTGRLYEVSHFFIPAILRHPLFLIAFEFSSNNFTVRSSEPEKLSDTILM